MAISAHAPSDGRKSRGSNIAPATGVSSTASGTTAFRKRWQELFESYQGAIDYEGSCEKGDPRSLHFTDQAFDGQRSRDVEVRGVRLVVGLHLRDPIHIVGGHAE